MGGGRGLGDLVEDEGEDDGGLRIIYEVCGYCADAFAMVFEAFVVPLRIFVLLMIPDCILSSQLSNLKLSIKERNAITSKEI
jgi:hypothetical protein